MTLWPRTFEQPYPSTVGLMLLTSLLAVGCGLVLRAVAAPRWATLPCWLCAIGVPLLTCLVETRTTIVCRQDDFTVERRMRWGWRRATTYPWASVVATEYAEFGDAWGGRWFGYFIVTTRRGRAFEVRSARMADFAPLIEAVNALTPQLPYVWLPRPNRAVDRPLRRLGFGRYTKVPREHAETPADEAR
ncbi:MAG TPA: hypothetical protein VFL91_00885 [Thermomicrobiales bacterium]|nr:hypothetical protein [Thermomicrobiales bacterium]